jgi:hypothetical protein
MRVEKTIFPTFFDQILTFLTSNGILDHNPKILVVFWTRNEFL